MRGTMAVCMLVGCILVALSLGSGRSRGVELSPAGEPVATTAAAADDAPEDEALAGSRPGFLLPGMAPTVAAAASTYSRPTAPDIFRPPIA
jgi:hypothetical protein